MADLALRWSLRRDLPAIPALSRFGGSALRYRIRRLWRPIWASLLLKWSLRSDLLADPAPARDWVNGSEGDR